jgi:PAS domain S-box-containing protein
VKNIRDHSIFTLDARGRITSWNREAERNLGYSEDEVLGQHFSIIFSDEDQRNKIPDHELRTALSDGRAEDERWHVRKDGERFWALGIVTPTHDAAGTHTGFSKILRDMTDRKRVEEALVLADRRKDEFLATLAHELRNPLAPIRNAIAVLQQVEPASEHALHARGVIDRQVTQLTRLVDDLLDISRITEGKIRLNRERLSLTDTIRRTVEDHRGPFERKGVALALESSGDPLWVDADPTRLVQVVGNLLENAAKFTNPGGHVAVTLAQNGDRALLRIRDDGTGMDEATLGRIFQPFVQADSTLARTQGGLGLGLALVKNLVELHGGSVEASSEGVGRGTEFLVALPAARA